MRIVIPPKGKGNAKMELGNCPDELKEALASKIVVEGASTEYDMSKKDYKK